MDWTNVSSVDQDTREQTLHLLQHLPDAWRTIGTVAPDVAPIVMDVLQAELDQAEAPDDYRSTCLRCLRVLGRRYDLVPTSFFCRNVKREGDHPIWGGGFADIWKGSMAVDDTANFSKVVCLKVLRFFITGDQRQELLKDCCREALVWRQLRHPNVLGFLGVNADLFTPSFCLISPWMANGNIMAFLQMHPEHNRAHSVLEIVEGVEYLHSLDPQIVHADIRGANILVTDDFHCCLADFGLSLVAESQASASSSRAFQGSIRWLPPECMDHTLFNPTQIAARDIYSIGCTIIELYTGLPPYSHIKAEVALIHEVLTLKRPPPRPPQDQFPSERLWSIVMECLSPIPTSRPSVSQLLLALKALQGVCLLCPFVAGVPCSCPPRPKKRAAEDVVVNHKRVRLDRVEASNGVKSRVAELRSSPQAPTFPLERRAMLIEHGSRGSVYLVDEGDWRMVAQ
ncbi:kinase-like protein [Hymenopellis radicata]|nr:kinase-like protein [Hymenopellis radicata]